MAEFTAGASTAVTGAITFLLLLIPTLLMGSTLPLLVAHLVRRTENVGESVGSLYSANTFGSATACLLAAIVLMRVLGESGCVRLAACMNLLVGTSALLIRSGASTANRKLGSKKQVDRRRTAQHNPIQSGHAAGCGNGIHCSGLRNHLVPALLLCERRQGAVLCEFVGVLSFRHRLRCAGGARWVQEKPQKRFGAHAEGRSNCGCAGRGRSVPGGSDCFSIRPIYLL